MSFEVFAPNWSFGARRIPVERVARSYDTRQHGASVMAANCMLERLGFLRMAVLEVL